MPTDQPSLPTVIREAIESIMVDTHTMMPGTVDSYDPDTQKADVQPGLSRVLRKVDGNRVAETLPVIPSVPVQFLAAGGIVFAPPVQKGTTGLLLFAEYSIDKWRQQGGQGDPGDIRRHGLSGAVFLPGLQVAASRYALSDVDGVFVIPAGKVLRMGSNTASESFILGDSFATEFGVNWLTTAFAPWLAAVVSWFAGAAAFFVDFASEGPGGPFPNATAKAGLMAGLSATVATTSGVLTAATATLAAKMVAYPVGVLSNKLKGEG